ncbi:MAG: 3-hydroxyacyl-CoA dehydrogenase family protein, partial [Thermoplasmata archaeon]
MAARICSNSSLPYCPTNISVSFACVSGLLKSNDRGSSPAPLMKGIEVIRAQLTSEDTFKTAWEFARSLGKDPVEAVDYAGFIVSRLVDVLMNEAVKMVQEGNRPEDIDKAMELCAGHPMGPCK